ncbi:MAG: hypothetical protein GTO53_07585 [Planctomycetales bacterium]|nr:hypothetical protein [Planctomycetales bacterium]NIM08998.1 hypothetical protein [Planctomycetales bacterium]NIN08461.1 hypothetical protein [Planctomycetales bacterium]NIN77595.1 hypothetical protein [Planctomycetales bacterium]NIO34760.1 hypothetical protein [Planctomycetales bacterium]
MNPTQPPVTFDGSIQPTLPGFDPYADPTQPGSPVLAPGLPATVPPAVSAPFGTTLPGETPCPTCPQPLTGITTFDQWPRFLQQVRLRHTWLNREGLDGLGWNASELSGTFLTPFPFIFRQNAPLLWTPGFAAHFTDGPAGGVTLPGPMPTGTGADLPARLYDAFLDVGWTPQVTLGLSADVGFRAGVYSDFQDIRSESWRFQGRGFGVWRTSDTHQWRAGVIYIDRVDLKLLPAGGLIWTPGGPQGNIRWELLFPNPKLAQRLTTWRNTDLWWYVAGEYGGGSWAVSRPVYNTLTMTRSEFDDEVDYNDIRILLGLETFCHYGLKALFEVGYVFNRKLDYFSRTFDFEPKETLLVRGGLTY